MNFSKYLLFLQGTEVVLMQGSVVPRAGYKRDFIQHMTKEALS